jgi:hypothetical protein
LHQPWTGFFVWTLEMESTYPAREKFFAHKFVRLLHKAAVASEIGRDAFALLTVIVHTEDAMRYRGAAKFWNSQLVETLGFKKWDQFDACRKRAIEAGWLIYVCHGKRMAGEYWVNVPDGYEMVTDAPIESPPESYPGNGYDVGYKAGYKAGYDVGYKQGMIEGTNRVRSGVRTGDEQGEPSIPIPNPEPIPKTQPAADEFDQFWQSYPRKVAKGTARKAWDKAVQTVDAQTIIDGGKRYAASMAGSEAKFIAHPTSWLNAERWADEPEPAPKPEIKPGTPEWAARSIKWLEPVREWQAMANRGEITDAEFNRRVAEAAARAPE